MAYNEDLAQRIRIALGGYPGLTERKMFGGLCFMLHSNMCCGVVKDDMMLRVGADQYEGALEKPLARPMDFTGRPMKGMVYVGPADALSDEALHRWVALAAEHALTLPPK